MACCSRRPSARSVHPALEVDLAAFRNHDVGFGNLVALPPAGGPAVRSAKIGIVDDVWLTVGSANLNDHSFFNDSEMNVVTCNPELARQSRLRLWAEHLELAVE